MSKDSIDENSTIQWLSKLSYDCNNVMDNVIFLDKSSFAQIFYLSR